MMHLVLLRAARRALLPLLLCTTVPVLHAQGTVTAPPRTSLRAALDSARRALVAGDHLRTRQTLAAALRLSPGEGSIRYYLARALVQTGDTATALQLLETLAAQGALRDIGADSALAPIGRGAFAERYQAVARRLKEEAVPLVKSDTAFTLADPAFVPEGIAYDPAGMAFYVGSLHGRGVLRITRDGRMSPFVRGTRDTLDQVLGIRVDPARQRLWLAAFVRDSAAPRFPGGIGGRSALHAYDLTSGRLVARIAVPDDGRPHLLNDIAIAPNGDVYVTDSEGDAVHRLRNASSVMERVYAGAPDFMYPNGITVSTDGDWLYFADAAGLSALDLRRPDARPERVTTPVSVSTAGIDGLYACGDDLFAVQRRLGYEQVTRFRLTTDGRGIAGAEALERRHPAHEAATTGAIADGAFYYIANAQLRLLGPDGEMVKTATPRRSLILRLPIEMPCVSGARE